MFWIILVSLAMGVGYLAALVGISPVAMFALVSFAALCGEYVRRLAYRFLKRRLPLLTPSGPPSCHARAAHHHKEAPMPEFTITHKALGNLAHHCTQEARYFEQEGEPDQQQEFEALAEHLRRGRLLRRPRNHPPHYGMKHSHSDHRSEKGDPPMKRIHTFDEFTAAAMSFRDLMRQLHGERGSDREPAPVRPHPGPVGRSPPRRRLTPAS